MLVAGVTVEYFGTDGRVRGAQVRVIDFDDPDGNDWLAVNQFTVVENRRQRRPDVVLFVNGLPLAVIELKNPADGNATIHTAWRQFRTYRAELPSLFAFNAVLALPLPQNFSLNFMRPLRYRGGHEDSESSHAEAAGQPRPPARCAGERGGAGHRQPRAGRRPRV